VNQLLEHQSRVLREEFEQGLRDLRAEFVELELRVSTTRGGGDESVATEARLRAKSGSGGGVAVEDAIAELRAQVRALRAEGEAVAGLAARTAKAASPAAAADGQLSGIRDSLAAAQQASSELADARRGFAEVRSDAERALAQLRAEVAKAGTSASEARRTAAPGREDGSAPFQQLISASAIVQDTLLSVADAAASGKTPMGEQELQATLAPLHQEIARLVRRPSNASSDGGGTGVQPPNGQQARVEGGEGVLAEIMDCVGDLKQRLQELTSYHRQQELDVAQAKSDSTTAIQDSGLALRGCQKIRSDLEATRSEVAELAARLRPTSPLGGAGPPAASGLAAA